MHRGPCSRAVATEIDRYLELRGGTSEGGADGVSETVAALREVRAALDRPVRVAVIGRVNAGKSTIVNALLHQRIAATDVSECTRHVTWFREGVPERVEVVLRSGHRFPVRLREDGRLPARLHLDADRLAGDQLEGPIADSDVDHLDVFLSNERLRELTIIDTPGIASVDAAAGDATRDLLALDRTSRAAASQADALVFVLGGELQRDDSGVLDAFHRLFSGLGARAVNTVAVLNKVDQLVDDEIDPVGAAADRCRRLSSQLRATVAGVVPLVGLLAETADTGVLTQRDVELLRAAAAQDPRRVERALLSVDRYLRAPELAPEPQDRQRLLELLDLSGTRIAIDALREGGGGLERAIAAIRSRSGIDALRDVLRGELTDHADVLQAAAAMSGVERIAYRAGGDERADLLDLLDGLAVDPAMHRLRELAARQHLSGGEVAFSGERTAELRALFTGQPRDAGPRARLGLPADASVRDAMAEAHARAQRWKQAANDAAAGAAQRDVAAVAARSYELVWQELLVSSPSAAAPPWPPPDPVGGVR